MIDFRELARGKWRAIHIAAGVKAEYLTGRHCPCPVCGGTDRFRWDNKDGSGSSYCSKCEPHGRTGLDLVMAIKGLDFKAAKDFVLAECRNAPVEARTKAQRAFDPKMAARLWAEAMPLSGGDPASKYLASRGIVCPEPPKLLRFAPRAVYFHDGGKRTEHPALVAKFVGTDGERFTLQHIFLKPDGTKADVPVQKRTLTGKGSIPVGGAVRLCNSAETMGIAEGIETALSAMQIFKVPVWATLTAGLLTAWEPPPTAKNILIYLDNDESYAGQSAAYALAHKLTLKGYHVGVKHPPELGMDWNDVIQSGLEGVYA